MDEQEKHRGGPSPSFSPVPSLAFPLACSLLSSLAGDRIRQKSTGAGTLNPARVPPHVREAVSVFDCSPTPCNGGGCGGSPPLLCLLGSTPVETTERHKQPI